MGLFDIVRCRYPLPDKGAQDLKFQTKSTLEPCMDNFLITEDGRLLREAYDSRWENDPESPFGAVRHRVNVRWEPVDFSGQMEIHDVLEDPVNGHRWCSYLLWFRDGRVTEAQHGPGHGEVLPNRPMPLD